MRHSYKYKKQTMKKIILISFAIAIVTANISAQEKKGPHKTPEQRAERRTVKLNQELALNEEQKVKVKEVVLKQELQRDESIKQFAGNREVLKEANKKNRKESEDELKSILTPEQIDKLKQHKEEIKQTRQKKIQANKQHKCNESDLKLASPAVQEAK
jgi:protein CpxP